MVVNHKKKNLPENQCHYVLLCIAEDLWKTYLKMKLSSSTLSLTLTGLSSSPGRPSRFVGSRGLTGYRFNQTLANLLSDLGGVGDVIALVSQLGVYPLFSILCEIRRTCLTGIVMKTCLALFHTALRDSCGLT